VGVETEIDRSLIDKSGYLEPSLLGWQLIYILPVAILTNDFFLSVSTFLPYFSPTPFTVFACCGYSILDILTLECYGDSILHVFPISTLPARKIFFSNTFLLPHLPYSWVL